MLKQNKNVLGVLFLIVAIFLTIVLIRGDIGNGLINIIQAIIDLTTTAINIVFTVFFFIVFVLIFYKYFDFTKWLSEKIKNNKIASHIKKIFSKICEYVPSSITETAPYYFCLVVYYALAVNFLAPFLVVEFGATTNALRYTIMASFTLIFLDRFFQKQKIKLNGNEKFGIREILLTIAFLGFLKTLMAGKISLATPEYEIMNLTFLIPLLDLIVIKILKLPEKIVPKINKITENKEPSNSNKIS